jgi:hypothetical protein
MIQRPSNWNEVQAPTESRKLDITAAVVGIKQAKVQEDDFGAKLCILFDIAEGDYTGWYEQDFKSQQPRPGEDKRWKGVLRLWLPKHDGSEKDEWTIRTLKGFTTAIEKSNPGYQWNWDERSLAGKYIGILYRNEEWEWEGKTGWSKRPFRAISIDSVREGSFKAPKDRPLKNKNTGGGFSDPGSYSGFGGYNNQSYGSYNDADMEESLPF